MDQAGSEGIADLYTFWVPPYHGYNHFNPDGGADLAKAVRFLGFDAAVPPVALLHQ